MRYFFAIVLPPLAVLFCGRPLLALLNLGLTLCGWLPGAIHACFVVSSHLADRRTERLERAARAYRAAA